MYYNCEQLTKYIEGMKSKKQDFDALFRDSLGDTKSSLEMREAIRLDIDVAKEGYDRQVEAKKLFGRYFFGPEEAASALGIEIDMSSVPAIPFSKEELERASNHDQFLIYRAPLTISEVEKALLAKNSEIKIVYDKSVQNQPFITEEEIGAGWALTSNDSVPVYNIRSVNYLSEVYAYHDYLVDVLYEDGPIPEKFWPAIQELVLRGGELEAALKSKNNVKGMTALANDLLMTRMFRHTPAEMLYDLVVDYKIRGQNSSLLEGIFGTRQTTNGANFVTVGHSYDNNIEISTWMSDVARENIYPPFTRRI
jgi:hypothetical protein